MPKITQLHFNPYNNEVFGIDDQGQVWVVERNGPYKRFVRMAIAGTVDASRQETPQGETMEWAREKKALHETIDSLRDRLRRLSGEDKKVPGEWVIKPNKIWMNEEDEGRADADVHREEYEICVNGESGIVFVRKTLSDREAQLLDSLASAIQDMDVTPVRLLPESRTR